VLPGQHHTPIGIPVRVTAIDGPVPSEERRTM
jgi:hypothetical protein